jgi:hypothetical protein
MDPAAILTQALRTARDIMRDSLGRSRALAILKLRELLWSAEITTALAASSDNCSAFAIRASRTVLADAAAWPDETLAALWHILDDPALDAALGLPHSSRAGRHHRWR